MKLYHGASSEMLPQILKRGLLPRGKKSGNWEHTIESRPDCVYLTNAYAPYFGDLIIEIDTNILHEWRLLPDEDAVEQCMRGKDGIEGDYKQRTEVIRNRLDQYVGNGQWKGSLQALGTCAYQGKIPPHAFTRYTVIPVSTRMYWDPVMVLLNYRLCGGRYRMQTARLFGDVPEKNEGLSFKGFGDASDWQIPMSEHDVHYLIAGQCVDTKRISAVDGRLWARKDYQELIRSGNRGII